MNAEEESKTRVNVESTAGKKIRSPDDIAISRGYPPKRYIDLTPWPSPGCINQTEKPRWGRVGELEM